MNGLYYTCNMKGSGWMNVFCIVARNHDRSVVVLDHSWNFKGILSIVVTTSKMEKRGN